MQTLINAACVPAVLFGMMYIRGRALAIRWAWGVVFGAVAVYKAAELIRIAAREVANPPLWDFKVFWMVGQICAHGANIYDVASYAPFRTILNPTGDVEFNTIALNIGMPYPPPAAALFCPLGHFASLSGAMAAWYGVIFAAIALSIVVLWRRFFWADGVPGLIAVAVCVLTLPGTTMTIGFGQLNFFALPLLVLVWHERIPWRVGMWLAPLVVIRPLTLLLALYFIVRRKWGVPLALIGTCGVLFLLSIPIIGVDAFASYLHHNPTQRYPQVYFRSWESLYKILVMLTNERDGFFSLATHPLFDLISAALVLGAASVCHVAGKCQRNVCLSMLLALALFLYPNTGAHYSVLLLVPMLSMWNDRARLGLSDATVVVCLGVQYLLLLFRDGALTMGFVFALDAAFFALLALRTQQSRVVLGSRKMTPSQV